MTGQPKQAAQLERASPLVPTERLVTCPYCGEPDAVVFSVSYDALVDGAGCVESEERCDACVGGESACEQLEAAE